jgi:predicted  nucleic acid-binding Zn-ribbon protein
VADLQNQESDVADALELSRRQNSEGAQEADRQARELTAQRSELAGRIPPELLSHYDSLRRGLTVAVAPLNGNQCGGCRLTLPPGEVADLMAAPVDAVVHCEECGCVLVRAHG